MRITTVLTVSALLAGGSPRLWAATIVIDGLKQGGLNYSVAGANNVNGANESGVDTINGNRASSIDHLFDAGTSAVVLSSGGPLTVAGTNDVLTLGYGETYFGGGMGGQPSTDLHVDLSGTNALDITFSSLSAGIYTQAFMYTDVNNGQYGGIDNNGHGIVQGSPGDLVIPYSALTNSVNGGVNLSKIDSILLTFQSQGIFTVAKVSAISLPEPATLLAPLGALLLMRRRR